MGSAFSGEDSTADLLSIGGRRHREGEKKAQGGREEGSCWDCPRAEIHGQFGWLDVWMVSTSVDRWMASGKLGFFNGPGRHHPLILDQTTPAVIFFLDEVALPVLRSQPPKPPPC